MNRRQIITAAGALLTAGAASRAWAQTAVSDPLSGASMMADVKSYVEFGIHRAGGAADLKVSDWMGAYWKSIGCAVERQSFEIPNTDTTAANLETSGGIIEGFGQPPMCFTPAGGLSAPLARWSADKPDAPMTGKIALIEGGRGGPAAAKAAGAVAIISISSNAAGQPVANNTDPSATFDLPVLNVGLKDKAKLEAAADSGAPVRLRLEGPGGKRTAYNTVARYGDTGKLLVISTPQSGWFTCGGERGPGIALIRGLSSWAVKQKLPCRLLFTSNSGHEWNYAGSKVFQASKPAAPADTAFWLHLGAGFGARNFNIGQDYSLTPLDEAVPKRNFMVSPNLVDFTKADFAGQDSIDNPLVVGKDRPAGELVDIMNGGYQTCAGFWAVHQLFHTPIDRADATTPQIMAALGGSLSKLIQQAVA